MLTQLFVGGNPLTSLKGIENAKGLTSLSVAYSDKLKDVSALAAATSLTELDLSGTAVTDLAPVGKLTMLQFLSIVETPVADVSPLKTLVRLDLLLAVDTRVTDWSPLDALVSNGLEIVRDWDDLGYEDEGYLTLDVSPSLAGTRIGSLLEETR